MCDGIAKALLGAFGGAMFPGSVMPETTRNALFVNTVTMERAEWRAYLRVAVAVANRRTVRSSSSLGFLRQSRVSRTRARLMRLSNRSSRVGSCSGLLLCYQFQFPGDMTGRGAHGSLALSYQAQERKDQLGLGRKRDGDRFSQEGLGGKRPIANSR